MGTRIIKTQLFGNLETRRRCRSVLGRYRKAKLSNYFEKGKDFGVHLGTKLRIRKFADVLDLRCESVFMNFKDFHTFSYMFNDFQEFALI